MFPRLILSLYYLDRYILVGLEEVSSSSLGIRPSLRLTVRDSGRGISPEFLEKGIFRAFSQENSNAQGVGLGLNICAEIVRSQEGCIEVDSCIGVSSLPI